MGAATGFSQGGSSTAPGGGTTVGVIGAGTVNILAKFTAASTIGNSLFYDNGTNTGVATATPGARFHIKGAGNAISTFGFRVDSSTVDNLFTVRNDGVILAGTGSGNTNLKIGQDVGSFGTGTDNVSYGYQALRSVTSGSLNCAFGSASMSSKTTGNWNSAFGTSCLQVNVSGSNNSAFGGDCMSSYLGSNNSAFGYRSSKNATTGDDNSSFGADSLSSNITGARNSAFGNLAGFSTTGAGGVYLGYGSGFHETTANRLFVDNALRASEADGRLKALIVGLFDADPANQSLAFNAEEIIMQYLQTGNAGLTTGKLYVDTAANVLANGDNVVAWKV